MSCSEEVLEEGKMVKTHEATGLSATSSMASLTSENITLNPNAKECRLNPNAKSFVPLQASLFYRVQVCLQSPEGVTTTQTVSRKLNDILKLLAGESISQKESSTSTTKGSLAVRSRTLLEKREELEATGKDVDDDSIFYEVLGGNDRKRMLYGFGSYGKLIPSKKVSNDTYYTPETNANKELAEKNAELAQMKELVTAQKEQNDELKELVKMQADQLKTQNEQSNSKIDKLEQLQQFFDSLKEKRTE